MGNEDGKVVLTYNGEVYNFRALRAPLEQQGHSFRTRSDTETILHHYEQHGAGGVAALEGMFAFAIWDGVAERLLLARDRCGIKPLYYAELSSGGLVFASELTALLAHGGVDRALGAEGLASYFFSDYVHPPHTLVGAVKKLPPGHTLSWERGRLEAPRPFWQVPAAGPAPAESGEQLGRRLWEGIERSVEAQLISDVPVGIFLSGGIDSSLVAAAAVKRAGTRMKAFSIGFEDGTFDETNYARLVAKQLGVEHVTETLSESNLLDVVDDALDMLDEPLADPSFIPTFLLSRLAARHVKVVVGGDGGDELWGGYPTYRAHRLAAIYAALPGWFRRGLVEPAVDKLPINDRYQSLEWKLRRFVGRWDDARVVRHLRWMSSVDLPELGCGGAGGAQPPAGDAGRAAASGRRLAQPDPGARLHDLHVRIGPHQGRSRRDGAWPRSPATAARRRAGRLRLLAAVAHQAAGAAEQVPAEVRRARTDPGRGDRSSEEGVRDSAGGLAARTAQRAPGGGARGVPALGARPRRSCGVRRLADRAPRAETGSQPTAVGALRPRSLAAEDGPGRQKLGKNVICTV